MTAIAALAVAVPSLAAPPLLHLTHRSESSTKITLLKSSFEICASDYPPPREPDWSKVGIEEQDEYFTPTKYALYRRGTDYEYELPDNLKTPCKLIETRYEMASLYDGKMDYEVDLVKRTGSKRERRYVNAKDQQQIKSGARAALASGMLGNLTQTAQKFESLAKPAGQEQIAGEKCNYYLVTEDTKLCYWSVLPEYPGIGASVILRFEAGLGKAKLKEVQEVVRFRKLEQIDPGVFTPPANIKWRN